MKKTVLITGTSGGFGADMVDTLHKAGHRVFASMRDAKSTARETAEKLQTKSARFSQDFSRTLTHPRPTRLRRK